MRKTHYVKTFFLRNDNQVQVELTINLKDAHEFERDQAENVIEKIFNPYNRIFTAEDTIVDWSKEKAIARFGEFK